MNVVREPFIAREPPRTTASSAPPLSVVHVVLSLDVGGLERIVVALAREGRALGQRVSVLCLERPGALAGEAEAAGARVICVYKMPGLRPGLVGTVAAAFRHLGPNVVHTHQAAALLYAGRAARRMGACAVIHTEHGKHYAGRWKTRLLGRVAARAADRFACVSSDIAAEVAACRIVPASKIVVVPNGIDVASFQAEVDRESLRRTIGVAPGAPLIGTVGRLCDVKRQDLLLRGFARLRARVPNARLVIVGDGPSRDTLKGLSFELGVADAVHFTGYQSQPQRFLAAMDVFALTSRSEGMPLVVLEAWAAGVPVVASRVGGLPELIEHGVNGLLFDSGDDAQLAEALHALATDADAADRLRGAGRAKVAASFHVRDAALRYQRHYLEMLPGGDDDDRRRVRDAGRTESAECSDDRG